MPFTKMHGIGNDYVYINTFATQVDDAAAVARAVAPRHTGIGSDGLILIAPSDVADVRMEMYNADGSRGEMCGNGIRCVGKFARDRGLAQGDAMTVETDAGIKQLRFEYQGGLVERVIVDMGAPALEPAEVPLASDERMVDRALRVDGEDYRITCVSMGNPHCVLFVPATSSADVHGLGRKIETHDLFPQGVNVEFVEVLGEAPSARLRMRVWERGSGETHACGTGACAAAVAAVLTGRGQRRVVIELLGGDLEIEWRESDNHILMTGGATEVFSGEIEL
ncbi:MAG: diaminopimelate epimerase [Deltaproteobacteria bacterium]